MKQVKHFVPNKDWNAAGGEGNIGGVPACNSYGSAAGIKLPAWVGFGEVAKTRRGVTCENCRRTRVFRKN